MNLNPGFPDVQQHPNKRELVHALTKLGVPYPPPSWGNAWDRIRAKTIEALAIIREKVRMLSVGSEVS